MNTITGRINFLFWIFLLVGSSFAQSSKVVFLKELDLLNLDQAEDRLVLSEKAFTVNRLTRRMNKGVLLYSTRDKNIPYTGWLKFFHDNEELRELCQIKNGLKDGYSVTWYLNGKKTGEYSWKDGKKHGFSKKWYVNGRVKSEEIWDNGKIESVEMWQPDGEKCPKTTINEGNGIWIEYTYNGEIKDRKNYENGFKVDISYEKNNLATKSISISSNLVGADVIIASFTHPVEILNIATKKKILINEVKVGYAIREGFTLKVGRGGMVVLLFSNGAVSTILENTRLVISESKRVDIPGKQDEINIKNETKDSFTLLDLTYGDLVVDVKKLNKNSSFEIISSLGVAGIRGTQFKISFKKGQNSFNSSEIIVTEGVVYCRPVKNGKELKVEFNLKIGEKMSYNSDDSYETLKNLTAYNAKKHEIDGIELIVKESRESADIIYTKGIFDSNKKSNKDRPNGFQKLRQMPNRR